MFGAGISGARAAGLCVAVLFGARFTLAGDTITFDNFPSGTQSVVVFSQIGNGANAQAADDFFFETPQPVAISLIEWQGARFGTSLHRPFNILFYADSDGQPTGGPGDPTSTALAFYGGLTATATPAGSSGFFDYSVSIADNEFIAQPNETYWIAIQQQLDMPARWGLSVSADQTAAAGVFGNLPLNVSYWTPAFIPPSDFAFRLHGTLVPEPGTLAGLVLGGALLGRRRSSQ